jgi:cation/acetate symporter
MVTNHELLRRLFGVSRPLQDCTWWGIEPVAAGVFGAPAGALVLVIASLLSRPPAAAEQAVVDRLRTPGWS